MKHFSFLFIITAIFCAAAFAPQQAEAQRSFFADAYSLDTLTNADTATWEFTKFNCEEQFDYTLNVYNEEVSGTATLNAILEQTACATCTDWVSTDTLAITATGNFALHLSGDNFWGYRHRVRFITSGTGVHGFYAVRMLRRRALKRWP